MFKTEFNNYAHYRRLGERETNLDIMRQQYTRSYNGQYYYQHTKIVTLKTHFFIGGAAIIILLSFISNTYS